MSRKAFMARLDELLADITEAEKEEALSYYEEYFEDAGPENEEEVISSLGSPEKVAATIKAGLSENAQEEGEFSETGYTNTYYDVKDEVATINKRKGLGGIGTGGWVIILILCLFALPILGPILLGIVGTIFGILVAIAAVIFAVLVTGIALVVAAVAMVAAGFATLFATPLVGVALIGAALLVAGIGILIAILGFWVVTKVIPPLFRGLVELIRKPFVRKGV
ncbi:MAG: DUF1700 domain-containing protein [Lachnospiraceae bacterium]|nr:DUF1700 domain-containing protein [Lachnospiraceae bacterium]